MGTPVEIEPATSVRAKPPGVHLPLISVLRHRHPVFDSHANLKRESRLLKRFSLDNIPLVNILFEPQI